MLAGKYNDLTCTYLACCCINTHYVLTCKYLIIIKIHDSESQGQEEAAVHNDRVSYVFTHAKHCSKICRCCS